MKIKFSPLIDDARGSAGNGVVKKVNGKYIVTRKPSRSGKPSSPSQLEVQDRFTDAIEYARDVMLNPELLALYEKAAEATGKSVYLLCRKDWFKPPRITRPDFSEYDGQVGSVIRFKVRDQISARKAIVTLSDDDAGTLIEKGLAVPEFEGSSQWMFTATKAVPAGVTVTIRIEAFDYPGNSAELIDTKRV